MCESAHKCTWATLLFEMSGSTLASYLTSSMAFTSEQGTNASLSFDICTAGGDANVFKCVSPSERFLIPEYAAINRCQDAFPHRWVTFARTLPSISRFVFSPVAVSSPFHRMPRTVFSSRHYLSSSSSPPPIVLWEGWSMARRRNERSTRFIWKTRTGSTLDCTAFRWLAATALRSHLRPIEVVMSTHPHKPTHTDTHPHTQGAAGRQQTTAWWWLDFLHCTFLKKKKKKFKSCHNTNGSKMKRVKVERMGK